jgi:hypothetical protein
MLIVFLAGCDDRYERRMLVPASAANTQEVVTAVSSFAREKGIACEPKNGALLWCYQQPTYLFVLKAKSGTEVCYSALTANRNFARSHDTATKELHEILERQFGASSVSTSEPSYEQNECRAWQ